MEQRLKERLTGAAILVALVVLIVPELFHGDIAGRASKDSAGNEGPPLRSYTIDLGGSRSEPMQITTPAPRPPPVTPAPAPAAITDASSSVAPPATPSATATVATPTPTTPIPAATASAHAPAQAAAPPHTSTQVATTHTAAHAATQPAAHKGASSTVATATDADWSVQLGLFAQRANAEHMLHDAQAKGFTASLSKPDAKGRYRVRVAGIANRSAALTLVARMHAAGLPAAAVGPQ